MVETRNEAAYNYLPITLTTAVKLGTYEYDLHDARKAK